MKQLKSKFDFSVNAYDELFMDDKMRAENRLPKIYDLPIAEIDDFPEHPYKVQDNEDMDLLTESIRENGVLSPVTVRQKEDGRYEMISGHRRKHACERLGLETIRAEIVEMTREEAVIAMVDSNCHRSVIMPSEKAFAYKMKYDAMKHQGTLSQDGTRLRTDEIIAQQSGESRNQIQRFIRLTYLIKPILDRVDNNEMAMGPAVELSYLEPDDQAAIFDIMVDEEVSPSMSQAKQLRNLAENGFDIDIAYELLIRQKPNQTEKISFSFARVGALIPSGLNHDEAEDFVVKSLEHYRQHLKQKQQCR